MGKANQRRQMDDIWLFVAGYGAEPTRRLGLKSEGNQ